MMKLLIQSKMSGMFGTGGGAAGGSGGMGGLMCEFAPAEHLRSGSVFESTARLAHITCIKFYSDGVEVYVNPLSSRARILEFSGLNFTEDHAHVLQWIT